MTVTMRLPWPPSTNRLWRHKGKKVYIDPKYKAWRKEAGWTAGGVFKVEGDLRRIDWEFSASLVLSPPDKRRRDLDNVIKPIFDLLQEMQWIKDDYLCQELHVKWDRKLPVGVTVTLNAYP